MGLSVYMYMYLEQPFNIQYSRATLCGMSCSLHSNSLSMADFKSLQRICTLYSSKSFLIVLFNFIHTLFSLTLPSSSAELSVFFKFWNGLFQKKFTHPRWMGFWKFLREGGQRPWKSRQERGLFRKSLLQRSFWPIVHAIRMFSSVTLQHSQTMKTVEIFCSHISHLRYHGRWIDSVWKSSSYADALKEHPINLYIL